MIFGWRVEADGVGSNGVEFFRVFAVELSERKGTVSYAGCWPSIRTVSMFPF